VKIFVFALVIQNAIPEIRKADIQAVIKRHRIKLFGNDTGIVSFRYIFYRDKRSIAQAVLF